MPAYLEHGGSEVSEKLDGKRKMPAVNWSEEIGIIAGPMLPSDTRESWLARAARKAGITFRQAKALRYGETKDPKHSVAVSVLSAADQARMDQARRDVQSVAEIYRSHAASLERIDADFHREQINALVNAARIIGAKDST
jgi:hypothetical protein